MEIYSAADHAIKIVQALNNRGVIYYSKGDSLKAMECYNKTLEMHRHANDIYSIAAGQCNLGALYLERCQFTRAGESLRESLDLSKKIDDKTGINTTLLNLGMSLLSQGDFELALVHFEKALETSEKLGDRWIHLYALYCIGTLKFKSGDLKESRRYMTLGLAKAEELGMRVVYLKARTYINLIDTLEEKTKTAVIDGETVLQEAIQTGDATCIYECRLCLSEIYLHLGFHVKARLMAARALRYARQKEQREFQWVFAARIGQTLLAEEKYPAAFRAYRLAISLLTTIRNQVEPAYRRSFFSQPRIRRILSDMKRIAEELGNVKSAAYYHKIIRQIEKQDEISDLTLS